LNGGITSRHGPGLLALLSFSQTEPISNGLSAHAAMALGSIAIGPIRKAR
jgi:hypothetical protein